MDSTATVTIADVMTQAQLSTGQARGQLAGLTMLLRNKKNGLSQNYWPFAANWDPAGYTVYSIDAATANLWQQARAGAATEPDGVNAGDSLPCQVDTF